MGCAPPLGCPTAGRVSSSRRARARLSPCPPPPSLAPQAGPAGPHAAVSRLCAQVQPCVHPPLSVRPRLAAPVVRRGPPRTLNTRSPHTRSAAHPRPTPRAHAEGYDELAKDPEALRAAIAEYREMGMRGACGCAAAVRRGGCDRQRAPTLQLLRARVRTCAALAASARARMCCAGCERACACRAHLPRPLAAPAFPLHTRVPHACSTAPLRPLDLFATQSPRLNTTHRASRRTTRPPRAPAHQPSTTRAFPPSIPPSLPACACSPGHGGRRGGGIECAQGAGRHRRRGGAPPPQGQRAGACDHNRGRAPARVRCCGMGPWAVGGHRLAVG